MADGTAFLGIHEGSSSLSFSCGSHDILHDVGEDVDGSIDGWVGVGGIRAEEVVATGTGSSLGCREVGGITVDVKDHLTCMEPDDRIRMGGCIV